MACCVVQMEQDEELNQLLHLAALDTFELSHALLTHQSRVAQLLNLQLLPCGAAAAQAAQAAVGQQQREAVAVEKLPVLGLAEPVAVSGLQEHPGEAESLQQLFSRTCSCKLLALGVATGLLCTVEVALGARCRGNRGAAMRDVAGWHRVGRAWSKRLGWEGPRGSPAC